MEIKQFVPSEICLKCDGCCRYKEPGSAWRPKMGSADKEDLAALITSVDALDKNGYIMTIQSCGRHFCRFLNQADNTCKVYGKRPFECSLYPFILSQTPDALKVYVHLSCPYVQDHLSGQRYTSYVDYLKEFFNRPQTKEFLSRNKDMFHDYSGYVPELLHLFDLSRS